MLSEKEIRARAEALAQGEFQGEVIVTMKKMNETNEKQWTAIEANRQRTEKNLEKIHKVTWWNKLATAIAAAALAVAAYFGVGKGQ